LSGDQPDLGLLAPFSITGRRLDAALNYGEAIFFASLRETCPFSFGERADGLFASGEFESGVKPPHSKDSPASAVSSSAAYQFFLIVS